MKRSKLHIREMISRNLSNSIKSLKLWLTVAVAFIFMFLNLYYTVDWSDPNIKSIGIWEICVISINILFFMMFYKTRTVLTYLYFITAYLFVITVLTLCGVDANILNLNVSSNTRDISVAKVIIIITVIFIVGFVVSNMVIIPFIGIMAILSLLQTTLIWKSDKRFWRMFWWFIFQVGIFFAMLFLIKAITWIEREWTYEIWNEMLTRDFNIHSGWLSKTSNEIYDLIMRTMLVLWFPLLIKINNLRGTDLFLSYSTMIMYPSLVSYLMSNIRLIENNVHVLSLPIFFVTLSSLWTLWFVYLFIITCKRNWVRAKKDEFIPYIIHRTKKEDIVMIWWKERLRLRNIEMKEKKEINEAKKEF